MKRLPFLVLFTGLFWSACVNEPAFSSSQKTASPKPLSILTEDHAQWKHENLRLYPVVASEQAIQANAALQTLKTLSEGMKTPGFRVMEQKQFGRSNDQWYHTLTVQNKTQDTVLLLSGEVVKGGNQDRIIAHHEVIMPMTVRNIEVFCVEAGRSSYFDPAAPKAEKEAAAFNGYYNVASPQVRRAVQKTGDQQEVWNAVASVTKANNAESSTKSYTALDQQNEEKTRRDAYLRQLESAFADYPSVVGIIAVNGDRVLGVDIFGSPDLFRRQYAAMLHGYVAEAAIASNTTQSGAAPVQSAFDKVARLAATEIKSNDEVGKFTLGGAWVHLFTK